MLARGEEDVAAGYGRVVEECEEVGGGEDYVCAGWVWLGLGGRGY